MCKTRRKKRKFGTITLGLGHDLRIDVYPEEEILEEYDEHHEKLYPDTHSLSLAPPPQFICPRCQKALHVAAFFLTCSWPIWSI